MNITDPKELKIEFQIVGIDILKFSYELPVGIELTQQTNFNFNIQTENKVNQNEKITFMIFKCEVSIAGQSNIIAEFHSSCVFSILNFDEVVTQDESNNFHINNHFLQTINMITISTARGLMYSAFKGTFLHAAILPLIDPRITPTTEDKNILNKKKSK